jgi:hypothetical protein
MGSYINASSTMLGAEYSASNELAYHPQMTYRPQMMPPPSGYFQSPFSETLKAWSQEQVLSFSLVTEIF